MLVILQQVAELSTPTLLAARLQDEDRRDNLRLREEQDAAYREALEADQVCISLTHYLKGLFLICSPAKVLYSSPAQNFSHKCFSRGIYNICKTNSIKQSQHL